MGTMPDPRRTRLLPAVSRRETLRLLGTAGALSLVRPSAVLGATCPATPAQTEGPYWVDERLQRVDITTDPTDGSTRPGVPLRLELTVQRTDAGCTPAAGVQVDVWHCDAAGRYSDEAANGTAGRKFLRGYQLADAAGVVRFTTSYPGWYPGRTIHVHYRVRTFDGGRTTFDFTSQLAFDDAVSDAVLSRAPYDSRGTRNTTNANDANYQRATELALTKDGGGWIGRYTVGLAGVPASSAAGGACADLAACGAAVAAALPDPTAAATARSRRIARRLATLRRVATDALDRAAPASAARRDRLYRRARKALTRLRTLATRADDRGLLGVSLTALVATVDALLALLPAA
jgi:protocatechuate 3,4-dioxygenase beta subunit